MSSRYLHNQNNDSIIIYNIENKYDILKTKITILFLLAIFSIIFGCLPIFFDRILTIKNFFTRIFKFFKKSKNDNQQQTTTTTTGSSGLQKRVPSTSIENQNQYFDNNRYDDNNSITTTTATTVPQLPSSKVIVNQKLKTHRSFHQLIKFLLCFGGGVLFFTSFIHLHPEIREIFKNLEKRKIFTNTIDGMGGIQTSELLICCGFFLIYLLEELMHYLIAIREMKNNSELVLHHALTKCNPRILWKRNKNLENCNRQRMEAIIKKRNDERHDFLDTYECHFGFDPEMIIMDEFSNNYRRDSLPMECPLSSLSSSNFGDQPQTQTTINTQSMSYVHLQGIQEYGINHPLSESSTALLMETSSVSSPPLPPPIPPPPKIDFENKYLSNNIRNLNNENDTKQNRTGKSVTFSIDQNFDDNNLKKSFENNHNTSNIPFQFNDNDNQNKKNYTNLQTILRGLVAIFALSIHSLFEGLAVGLEKNISSIWYLFLAIGTHKFVIIFCIGIELVAAKFKPLWIIIYIVGFALVTPFGILIGSLIAHSYETDKHEILSHTEITSEGILLTIAAMLQAVAAGTLLYVIFFEIMIKERHHHHHFETESNNFEKGNDKVFGHLHHSAESLIQCFAVGCGFMFMVIVHTLISTNPHGHNIH